MAAPRYGPRRRACMACAPTCRRCSASGRRSCASSSSTARDRTAPTAPITSPRMRCCCRRPSASRYACSGCAPTSTAGIRKARSSCWTCAPPSIPTATSSRGRRRCGCRTRRPAHDVITRPASAFKWDTRPSPNPRAKQGSSTSRGTTNLLVGRGIAHMRYKQMENYVAMAMEVAVNPSTGQIQVRRVACAHDCGMIVNPDGLRNQVEGCIVQTLSRGLHEEVTFDRSRVTSVDWVSYPILRFPEAPAVEGILIDRPNEPLVGAGEAATAPVAAALANAVVDATGVRLRTVPFTPARVKAALARADLKVGPYAGEPGRLA